VKSKLIIFGGELGCFFSFLTVKENAGMPENYRL
jgi:hypothetical protein